MSGPRDDLARRKIFDEKVWDYAWFNRHGPLLIVCEFSKSRTRDNPLTIMRPALQAMNATRLLQPAVLTSARFAPLLT
jgi:hypothetical protein